MRTHIQQILPRASLQGSRAQWNRDLRQRRHSLNINKRHSTKVVVFNCRDAGTECYTSAIINLVVPEPLAVLLKGEGSALDD